MAGEIYRPARHNVRGISSASAYRHLLSAWHTNPRRLGRFSQPHRAAIQCPHKVYRTSERAGSITPRLGRSDTRGSRRRSEDEIDSTGLRKRERLAGEGEHKLFCLSGFDAVVWAAPKGFTSTVAPHFGGAQLPFVGSSRSGCDRCQISAKEQSRCDHTREELVSSEPRTLAGDAATAGMDP